MRLFGEEKVNNLMVFVPLPMSLPHCPAPQNSPNMLSEFLAFFPSAFPELEQSLGRPTAELMNENHELN